MSKMAEVDYSCAMAVTESWLRLKRIPDYQDATGQIIFERLLELCPKARDLFGFTETEDVHSNPRFHTHARIMVDMIDCAVSYLGPDLDPLREELFEIGERHVQYGVKPHYVLLMGVALTEALEKVLGPQFSKKDLKSWKVFFGFISSNMIASMKKCGSC